MPIRVLFLLMAASCAAQPSVTSAPPKDETLGQCLARKKVHLYGAFWCGHCQDQLRLFGEDAKNVPYTDCQPEGAYENIPECDALGIDAFPTWVLTDGHRTMGTRSLEWLAASTDCPLR